MAKPRDNAAPLSSRRKRRALAARRERRASRAGAPGRARDPADVALHEARRAERRPLETIAALFAGEHPRLTASSPLARAAEVARSVRAGWPGAVAAGERLLRAVWRAAPALLERDLVSWSGALLALSVAHERWLRAPETFAPARAREARGQLAELAGHLLARYPVPRFLDAAWLEEPGHAFQQLWEHVARGENLRTARDLPLPLTRRAAHFALAAPDDMPILAALRWGQARALGADSRVANGVLQTPLRERFVAAERAFHEELIRWFMAHPEVPPARYEGVVAYALDQRYGHDPSLGRAPRPGFSLRGRTPTALLREVDAWRERLRQAGLAGRVVSWPHAARIADLELELEGRAVGRVVQLLSSLELHREGEAMHHCVGSYVFDVVRGGCSIWSVQRRLRCGRVERLATVEVRPRWGGGGPGIVQARACWNVDPSDLAWELIERWAALNGLQRAPWVTRGEG